MPEIILVLNQTSCIIHDVLCNIIFATQRETSSIATLGNNSHETVFVFHSHLKKLKAFI